MPRQYKESDRDLYTKRDYGKLFEALEAVQKIRTRAGSSLHATSFPAEAHDSLTEAAESIKAALRSIEKTMKERRAA